MTCPGAHWPRWMVCSFVPLAHPFPAGPSGWKTAGEGQGQGFLTHRHFKEKVQSAGSPLRSREMRIPARSWAQGDVHEAGGKEEADGVDELVDGKVPKNAFQRERAERQGGGGPQGRCPLPSKEWNSHQLCAGASWAWSHRSTLTHGRVTSQVLRVGARP